MYTKLFASIITSTIWTEDDQTRIVWITMLALADKNGEIQASIPGLARISSVSVEACEAAINKFLSPDRYSRTPDDEGRRIEVIPGGWALLNHGKYRLMASKDDSVSKNAERQKRHRQRKKSNAAVTDSNGGVTHERDIADAEADADSAIPSFAPDGASSAPSPPKVPGIAWEPERGFIGIKPDDWSNWAKAYPAVDLESQAARASEWLKSNPAKRKKAIRRFLTNWFSRSQEKGGDIRSNVPKPENRKYV